MAAVIPEAVPATSAFRMAAIFGLFRFYQWGTSPKKERRGTFFPHSEMPQSIFDDPI